MAEEERTVCGTPAEGRDGTTSIPTWKFDLLRGAIRKVLSDAGTDGLLNKELRDAVAVELHPDQLDRLGKLGWHVVTVKLEMEVREEIERMDVKGPLRIRLVQ